MHHGRHLAGHLRRPREDAQDRSLVRNRSSGARAGLFDHIRWAAAQRGEEDAVPSGGVDDRELLLDHLPRLDKPERQEIVGYV